MALCRGAILGGKVRIRLGRRALLSGVVGSLAAACFGARAVPAQPSSEPPVSTESPSAATPTVIPAPTPTPTPEPNPFGTVDATTLERKMLFGYQSWFGAAGDGSKFTTEWLHWTANSFERPNASNVMVDNWPDLSEFAAEELYATDLRYPDGRTVYVYSGFARKTIQRHFRWMGEYGLDGVLVQRFLQVPWDPRALDFRDTTLRHARAAAEQYGRVFAVEMDLSGVGNDWVRAIQNDWQHIVDELRLTESARYVRHRGRPLLAIWGFGFGGVRASTADARAILRWLQRDAPERYRATVMGGFPHQWRTGAERNDPEWPAVFREFDVISPWNVGAMASSDAAVDEFRARVVVPDVAAARAAGRDYMPVVFPGFSWSNLSRFRGPNWPVPERNSFPRRGGAFWWKQLYELVAAGCTLVKGAMFDELDEGTAMYKLARTAADAPLEPGFVTLDAEGNSLPSDWYLRLAGQGGRMLRGEIARSATIPIRP